MDTMEGMADVDIWPLAFAAHKSSFLKMLVLGSCACRLNIIQAATVNQQQFCTDNWKLRDALQQCSQ